jgi:hypothetical protein
MHDCLTEKKAMSLYALRTPLYRVWAAETTCCSGLRKPSILSDKRSAHYYQIEEDFFGTEGEFPLAPFYMNYRRKLSEVSRPLEAIHKESAREKSIRYTATLPRCACGGRAQGTCRQQERTRYVADPTHRVLRKRFSWLTQVPI